MKGLRFEELQEHHIPTILEIEKLCESSPWSEAAFRNELDHAHSIFLVAIVKGDIVGFGGVWVLADEAHITTIAVHPDQQRQGIGRALMDELISRAKERGAVCSTLEVRAGNVAAITLYEDMGYVRSGLRKRYYPDNNEDAVIMWLHDLE